MTVISPVAQQPASFSQRWVKFQKWIPAYSMMVPFLLLFFVFTVWPLLQSFYLSFTDYTGVAAKQVNFIGFGNFTQLWKDPRFQTAMWNISRYVILSVAITTVIGLILAIIFQAQGKLNQIARTLLFMPSVTSGIATLTIWQFVFRSDKYGLINSMIVGWGGKPIPFLARPEFYMPLFIFITVWGGSGMTMIFILAGLKSISKELYEAAAIDGATPWQRFWGITLPLLRPTLLYVVTTGMIGAFQLFDMAYIIGGGGLGSMGGPLDAGLTPVLYLYYLGFTRQHIGMASALAWMLFGVIIVISFINLRVGRFSEDV